MGTSLRASNHGGGNALPPAAAGSHVDAAAPAAVQPSVYDVRAGPPGEAGVGSVGVSFDVNVFAAAAPGRFGMGGGVVGTTGEAPKPHGERERVGGLCVFIDGGHLE